MIESHNTTFIKDVTPDPFSMDVMDPHRESGESIMLQIAAQWLEFRSQPQEEEEDCENEELTQLSPLQVEEECSLLNTEMVAHQIAVMNPIPPVTFCQEKGATVRRQEISKRNMLPIPNTARTSLRYELSSTETAAVASSFLLDLIEGGILSQEFSYLTLDKSKVQRWINQVMFQARENAGNLTTDETIKGIFFDARKDNTLHNEKDPVTGRLHPRIKKESCVCDICT